MFSVPQWWQKRRKPLPLRHGGHRDGKGNQLIISFNRRQILLHNQQYMSDNALVDSQIRTDENVRNLVVVVDRYFTEGRNGR